MSNPDFSPLDSLTYEQAFAELQTIVSALEAEDHPLEQSIALFERGQKLAQHCASLLDNAELRVQQLTEADMSD
ncbi:MAG TPA: exodeoxyribonuclease VII small subunit [Anaerolineales bacterium]|jgi:exodeoxyribonuclease VII small subunit|nr:exodeoxyribonuclease VII small subunit [Anaerolineales bacterium]